MLSPEALAVMRRPHPSGEAAMRMLEREGFASEGYIDIFDGGPTMSAKTRQIRTVKDARELRLTALCGETDGEKMLAASGRLLDFAATFAHGHAEPDGTAVIDAKSAAVLGIGVGDTFLAVGR
jgi:arginine N-succinyltransferase